MARCSVSHASPDAILAHARAEGLVSSSWVCRPCGFTLRRHAPPDAALPPARCFNCEGDMVPWDGSPVARPQRPPKHHPEPL